MTITLGYPVSPTSVGPGYSVAWTSSLGGAGDRMNVSIFDPAAGLERTYAVVPMSGPGGFVACLGVDGLSLVHELNGGYRGAFAQGAAVNIIMTQTQTPFGIRDSATFTGFTWDSVSALYVLLQRLALGGASGASLANIYAAVHRDFP